MQDVVFGHSSQFGLWWTSRTTWTWWTMLVFIHEEVETQLVIGGELSSSSSTWRWSSIGNRKVVLLFFHPWRGATQLVTAWESFIVFIQRKLTLDCTSSSSSASSRAWRSQRCWVFCTRACVRAHVLCGVVCPLWGGITKNWEEEFTCEKKCCMREEAEFSLGSKDGRWGWRRGSRRRWIRRSTAE